MKPAGKLRIQRETLLLLTRKDSPTPREALGKTVDTLLEPTCTGSGTVCHYC